MPKEHQNCKNLLYITCFCQGPLKKKHLFPFYAFCFLSSLFPIIMYFPSESMTAWFPEQLCVREFLKSFLKVLIDYVSQFSFIQYLFDTFKEF